MSTKAVFQQLNRTDEEALGTFNAIRERAWRYDVPDVPNPFIAVEVSMESDVASVATSREYYLMAAPEPVAVAVIRYSEVDSPNLASTQLMVDPGCRRRGVGSTLLEEVERVILAKGRTIHETQSWLSGGERIEEGVTEFALSRGYLSARRCVIAMYPVPPATAEAGASGSGRDDYEMIAWDLDCPNHLVEDFANLRERFHRDAPRANLSPVDVHYDVDRLRREEEAHRRWGERRVSIAAQHRVTGELVGATQIDVPAGLPLIAYQGITIVDVEHRGHGLGLRMKRANLIRLADAFPSVQEVATSVEMNNEHMMGINVQLGALPRQVSIEWRKDLQGA